MNATIDKELEAIILDLSRYLCVSQIRDYHTELGSNSPVVRALWVAAHSTTGTYGVPRPANSEIPVIQCVHWLWCEDGDWAIDYPDGYGPPQRKSFASKAGAVSFLKERIEGFWVGKVLTQPSPPTDDLKATDQA